MTTILCLAHYCDSHGPTPLMVTEGLPVPCNACAEIEAVEPLGTYGRPRSRAQTPTSSAPAGNVPGFVRTAGFREADHGSSPQTVGRHDDGSRRSSLIQLVGPTAQSSAIETPPESPGRSLDRQDFASSSIISFQRGEQPSRQSSFRKTYDDSVTKRIGPCENCAMTLPQRNDAAGSGTAAAASDARGPTLRTRTAYARVYGASHDASPPSPLTSSSSVSEDERQEPAPRGPLHRRTDTVTSSTSRSSNGSFARRNAHTHYLDYTSTHEPLRPASFSSVRASCLRTLSFETLPRTPGSTTALSQQHTGAAGAPQGTGGIAAATTLQMPTGPLSPLLLTSSPQNSTSSPPAAFVTTHSAGAAVTGGPIFFGDPAAGYTTAYIFRIPDVHARGHKRIYAFLALTSHRERQAMRAFPLLSTAFRDLAAWIQALAEAEAERAASLQSGDAAGSNASGSSFSPRSSYSSTGAAHGSSNTSNNQNGRLQSPDGGGGGSGMGGSSFLAAGMGAGGVSRRAGAGGFGGGAGGIALKQRGLAELVGLPDFFIQLHARFVRLLVDVGLELSS